MQHDIEQIRRLCGEFKTEAKVLVIPSARIRVQLLKTLGDHEVFPLNLHVLTVRELAYRISEHRVRTSGLTPLDAKGVTDVMTDVLKALRERDVLCFLKDIEITSGISKALAKTVLELLSWGYLHGYVGLEHIKNKSKQADIKLIIDTYVALKKKARYVDYTDVLDIALSVLNDNNIEFAGGYVLEACEFSYLEEQLIKKLDVPVGVAVENKISSPAVRACKMSFVSAYGEYNEAKEILRRIISENIPFDKVLIVSTISEPYSQLFHQLLQQYIYRNDALEGVSELPVTFGTGLPLLMSSPAKLLMLLLDWIGSGYSRQEFTSIFSSGVFDLKVDQRDINGNLPGSEDVFSKLSVVNVLKNSGLTWQRRSYVPCLEKHAAYLREKRDENSKSIKAVEWLIMFVKDVFESLSKDDYNDDDGTVNVESLLDALKAIVGRYKRVFSAFDGQGLRVVMNELSTTIKDRRVPLSEAIEIIKEHMRDVRIMCQSPAPGKLHLTTYRQAAWIEREHVFLVGLGSDCFPGMALEDPFLLDDERSKYMIKSVQRIDKNIKIMNSFLESIAGELTCSYNSFDTVENRECFPATLFHKLLEGAAVGMAVDDGAAVELPPVEQVGFVVEDSGQFIDDDDYWLYKGVKYGAAVGEEPGSPQCTVPSHGELHDPNDPYTPMWEPDGRMSERVLSATSLSDYLKCKHMFFLKHILRLKEIKERELDTLGWLSSLETGIIYHTVFEKFLLHAMSEPSVLADAVTASEFIIELVEKEIARCEDELPTGSEFHTERQREEVLANAVRFAELEVELASQRTAVQAEMSFRKEPVIIDLGDDRMLKVSGVIDRINVTKDGRAEIVDYKTGSNWYFENMTEPQESGITESNAQLALYYLALREIARTSDDPNIQKLADIESISYQFITAKGDYETITIKPGDDAEDSYKEAFLELINDLDNGEFPPEKGALNIADEKELQPNCRYCGFVSVCAHTPDDREF